MSSLIPAASSHYHSGRYSFAVDSFQRYMELSLSDDNDDELQNNVTAAEAVGQQEQKEKERKLSARGRKRPRSNSFSSDDSPHFKKNRVEEGDDFLAALPALSIRADIALCQARSAIHSNGRYRSTTPHLQHDNSALSSKKQTKSDENDKEEKATTSSSDNNVEQLLRKAMEANNSYRQALIRVLKSYAMSSSSPSKRICVQLASSILMASVSESWLFMQLGGEGGGGTQNRRDLSLMFNRAARFAASSLLLFEGTKGVQNRINPMVLISTTEEAMHLLRKSKILCLDERGSFALRSFLQARNVVRLMNLADDDDEMEMDEEEQRTDNVTNESHQEMKRGEKGQQSLNNEQPATRTKSPFHSDGMPHNDDAPRQRQPHFDSNATMHDNNKNDAGLHVRELLTNALVFHVRATKDNNDIKNNSLANDCDDINENSKPISTSNNIPITINNKSGETCRLLKERDSLLERAVTVSNSSCGGGGLAKRVQILLHSLSILSLCADTPEKQDLHNTNVTFIESSSSAVEASSLITTKEESLMKDLRKLTPSCREAWNILGCIRAKCANDLNGAIESFERGLEWDEKYGAGQAKKNVQHKVTVSNMAQCFMLLGGASAAEELLLYLLSIKQTPDVSSLSANVLWSYPVTLTLTSSSVALRASRHKNTATEGEGSLQRDYDNERRSLLWRIFQASTHAEDWATCIASTEELCTLALADRRNNLNSVSSGSTSKIASDAAMCARVFALLQGHNPTQALDECQKWMSSGKNGWGGKALDESEKSEESLWGQLLSIAFGLYKADGALLTEKGFHDDDDCSDGNEEKNEGNTRAHFKSAGAFCSPSLGVQEIRQGMDCVSGRLSAIQHLLPGNENTIGAKVELSVAVENNHGLALLMEGKITEALHQFQEAVIVARNQEQQVIVTDERNGTHSCNNKETSSFGCCSSLFLSPHFNLSLLLWKDSHRDEATNLWLHARGMGQLSKKNLSGSERRELKSALEEVFNRYGLLIAEKSLQSEGTGDDYLEHVAPWQSTTEDSCNGQRIGGLDAAQVLSLDLLVLRHAVAAASRRGAISHLRSTGGLSLSSFAAVPAPP